MMLIVKIVSIYLFFSTFIINIFFNKYFLLKYDKLRKTPIIIYFSVLYSHAILDCFYIEMSQYKKT